MPNYREAPEVEEIAKELIDEYHNQLVNANIAYVFRDKASKRNGKVQLGKARKTTGLYKELTGLDFIIEIAEDEWCELRHNQRVALVDHELSHFGLNEKSDWAVFDHDFTGFLRVLDRHGFWLRDLKQLHRKMNQLKLEIDEQAEAHNLRVVGKND